MNCYKVKVKCTNCLKDTFQDSSGEYHDCEDGEVYIVTNNPTSIYGDLGGVVISIEKIGEAYQTSRPSNPKEMNASTTK